MAEKRQILFVECSGESGGIVIVSPKKPKTENEENDDPQQDGDKTQERQNSSDESQEHGENPRSPLAEVPLNLVYDAFPAPPPLPDSPPARNQQQVPDTVPPPKPSAGEPAFKGFGLPYNNRSAKFWIRMAKRRPPNGSFLMKKVSHLDAQIFEAPDGGDWRCIGCATDEQRVNWTFRYMHCTGLTTKLEKPYCPGGCRNVPYKVTSATRCPTCLWVAALHSEEVLAGRIFQSDPRQP